MAENKDFVNNYNDSIRQLSMQVSLRNFLTISGANFAEVDAI